jgi:signal transduction histidine kinase
MAAWLSVRRDGWPISAKESEDESNTEDQGDGHGLLGVDVAGLTSDQRPVTLTNGTVAAPQQLGDPGSEATEDDQAIIGRDQTLADADQTASDSDQTAADSDQTAADSDQAAAESDQAASDRDLVEGGDPRVHSLTRGVRDRNTQKREHGSQRRSDTAADRDGIAHARDLAALARDQAAEVNDRLLAARDVSETVEGGAVAVAENMERAPEDRRRAAAERSLAAEARARAASDREHAAHDRQQAARDRSQAREEAELATRAKGAFLSSMSHELRTPLNAVLGFTGTLLMGLHGPLADEQVAHLATVQSAGTHLLASINSLLDLARLESDEDQHLESVDCRDLLGEVAVGLRPLAAEKGLEFEVLSGPEPIELICDRRAVMRILMNLADNAIDFTDEGSVRLEVDQRFSEDRSVTRFAVIDTGCGIAPEVQKQLLTTFDRIGAADDRSLDGNGLGLYISQSLAGLIGGRITFDSAVGEGSTFVLEMAGSVG